MLGVSAECRYWQAAALGAASGSGVFDACDLGQASLDALGALGSLAEDDYFLLFAEMCGNGEIVLEIDAAPAAGGWAGLEVREGAVSGARKYGLRTQTGGAVMVMRREAAGQDALINLYIKPGHRWLKIARSGNTFMSYTSFNGLSWSLTHAAAMPLPYCLQAGAYAQSADTDTPTAVQFNQLSIADEGLPASTVSFADSTLSASAGENIQICVDLARPCPCDTDTVWATVTLASAAWPHLAGFTPQELAFSGGSTQACFTAALADTAVAASYVFSLQVASGGTAQVAPPSQLTLQVATGLSFCGVAPPPPPADGSEPPIAIDRFGHAYTKSQLELPALGDSLSQADALGYVGCDCGELGFDTGYFDIWFEDCRFNTESGFDDPFEGEARQRVVCQVFQEIAALIQPMAGGCGLEPQAVQVQILPSGIGTPYASTFLGNRIAGVASAYYPLSDLSRADGLPWRIINSGAQPLGWDFLFHGYIRINFHSPDFNWFTGLPPFEPDGTGLLDLHSVVWHEAVHMLGFSSAFFSGSRVSRYDRFLQLQYPGGADIPVVQNINPPSLEWIRSPAILDDADLFSSCQNAGPEMIFRTPNGDYPVHTSDQFRPGESHSHLVIDCSGAPGSTPAYLMASSLPAGVRRPITAHELNILCTLGYTIAADDYACGCTVASADDFGPDCEGLFRMSLCDEPLAIPAAHLLQNDVGTPDGAEVVYVELLDPTMGEVSLEDGIVVFTPARIGLAVFAYLAIGCGGQEANSANVYVEVFADPDCPLTFACEGLMDCADFQEHARCFGAPVCDTGNGCNLLCNGAICGLVYGRFNAFIGTMTYYDAVLNQGIAPNWYRTHGTPDIVNRQGAVPQFDFFINLNAASNVAGGSNVGGALTNNSEGVMTPVELEPSTIYLLGIDYRHSLYHGEAVSLHADLIDGAALRFQREYNSGLEYSGAIQNLYSDNTETPELGTFEKRGIGCFSVAGPNLNALWLHAEAVDNSNGSFQVDNIEIVADNFSAGGDVELAQCGDEARLGGPFCMISGIEITYQWHVGAELIAEYRVLDGEVAAVVLGDIDLGTQQLIINPVESAVYTLSRQITNREAIGLPADFQFCAETDAVQITVLDCCEPPALSIVLDSDDGCGAIQFGAASQGPDPVLVELSWDFGDGATASGANPAHVYAASGVYEVVLSAENDCGATAVAALTVSVSLPAVPPAGFEVELDPCSGTLWLSALPGAEAYMHLWELSPPVQPSQSGTGLWQAVFQVGPGTYTVSHSVWELACGTGSYAEQIVEMPPPPPPLGEPAFSILEYDECGGVTFRISGSLGGVFDFGDGSSIVAEQAGPFAHQYLAAGDYTVVYTLSDECGEAASSEVASPQIMLPGDAAFSAERYCLGIVAAAQGPGAAHFTYSWDFGDGSSATGMEVSHTYAAAGSYTVTLTVEGCGQVLSSQQPIVVEDCGGVTLSCGCPEGYEILGQPGQEVRLSTLIALGVLPAAQLADACLAVAPGLRLLADESYDIIGGEAYMHPGSQIAVQPSAGSSPGLSFALSGMQASGGLQGCGQMWRGISVENARFVAKGGRIADAQYAVWARDKALVSIQEAYFSRNYVSLYAALEPNQGFGLEAFWGAQTSAGAGLLPPYPGQQPLPGATPYAGVEVRDVPALLHIGAAGAPINTFEGLANGILAERAPLLVERSAFAGIGQQANEPYPYSGYGIRHVGGAAHPLALAGLGGESSAPLTFDGCAVAVWCSGTDARISSSNMADVAVGIHLEQGTERNLAVEGNRIAAAQAGVRLSQNSPAGSIRVSGNVIRMNEGDFLSAGRGIQIDEAGLPQSDAVLEGNIIDIFGWFSQGISLHSASGYQLIGNDVSLGSGAAYLGIAINGGDGNLLSGNTATGASRQGVGFNLYGSSSIQLDCNTAQDLGFGLNMAGSLSGADIATTLFRTPMGIGLRYADGVLAPQQNGRGNRWEGAAQDYSVAAARHEGGDAADIVFGQHRVHQDYDAGLNFNFFPPSISLPHPDVDPSTPWFEVDDEEGFETCTSQPQFQEEGEMAEKLRRRVAQDSIGNFAEGVQWDAGTQLYLRLLQKPELLNQDTLWAGFFARHSQTNLGQLAQLEHEKAALFAPSQETEDIALLKEDIRRLSAELQVIDSLAAADSLYQIPPRRAEILEEIGSAVEDIMQLEEVATARRMALAEGLLTLNAAVTAHEDPAIYQAECNDIYLSKLAQNSFVFTPAEKETLDSIAVQCPELGGHAVFAARALRALYSDELVEADGDCAPAIQPLRTTERPDALQAQERKEKVYSEEWGDIRIFPNPASNSFTVSYSLAQPAEMRLYDVHGRLQATRILPAVQAGREEVAVQALSPGIYVVVILAETGERFTTRLSIMR